MMLTKYLYRAWPIGDGWKSWPLFSQGIWSLPNVSGLGSAANSQPVNPVLLFQLVIKSLRVHLGWLGQADTGPARASESSKPPENITKITCMFVYFEKRVQHFHYFSKGSEMMKYFRYQSTHSPRHPSRHMHWGKQSLLVRFWDVNEENG